jgi:hypothetical protein
MSRIHLRVPREAAWAFLTDLSRNEEWVSSVQTVLSVSDGPLDVGTVFRERLRIFGPFHTEAEWRITQSKAPYLHEHQGLVPITGETTVRYTIEPAEGGCDCIAEVAYSGPPWGVLGRALDALLVRPNLGRVVRGDLRRLKRLVETQARV